MPIEMRGGRAMTAAETEPRQVGPALLRGLRGYCPACGHGALFRTYLKVNDRCPACAMELFHHRADDAPPYFVMLIVGHLIVGLVLTLEQTMAPPMWLHAVIFAPVTVLLALVLLPPVKGALVALQWALRMHGFDGAGEEERA